MTDEKSMMASTTVAALTKEARSANSGDQGASSSSSASSVSLNSTAATSIVDLITSTTTNVMPNGAVMTKINLNLPVAPKTTSHATSHLPTSPPPPPSAARSNAVSDAEHAKVARKLKRAQKENAALQAELEGARKRIAQLKHERKYSCSVTCFSNSVFLDKVYENEIATMDVSTSGSESEALAEVDLTPVIIKSAKAVPGASRGRRKEAASSGPDEDGDDAAMSDASGPGASLLATTTTVAAGEQARKKTKKHVRPIADTIYRIVSVPTDAEGRTILPFSIGLHTIHSLGEVAWDRPAYHNKRYIMPIGFHSSRPYPSTVNSEANTTWHSRILDGGPSPLFEVTAEDDPAHPFTGGTSTGVWSAIMKQAASIRSREPAGSASGPDFFGLGNATVAMLIERLPGADRCQQYERKRYEMSAKGHAAVAVPTSDNTEPVID